MRAEQDAKFLIEEHANLICQIENAEDINVKIRKEIRLLETELYVMFQRNAHDSAVIDGLQEADHSAMETDLIKFDISHKIQIAKAEGGQEDILSDILKEEISLLKRKDVEDKELINSLKPLQEKLKKTLDEEKVKNHQQGMKFKREFEDLLQEFGKRNSDLEAIVTDKSSAILWALETFSLIFGDDKESNQQQAMSESEADSDESSRDTDPFDVSSVQGSDIDKDDLLGKDFEKKKEEYSEFVALKELLDSKNLTNISVVLNCLKQFSEGVQNLTQEYLSVFEVIAEIAFIKEYLQRLDLMRKKKDVVINQDSIETAQRLDQLSLIYNSLMYEKAFFLNLLQYFTSTLPEDFEVHCVNLHKTEESFNWTVQSENEDEKDAN